MIVFPATPQPPHPVIILLEQVKIALTAVDWLAELAVAYSIRHVRNRQPMSSEMPCLSIGFVNDAPEPDERAPYRNAYEAGRILDIDLQFDLNLSPEDSGLDPTGWGELMRAAAVAYRALNVDDGTFMSQFADYVQLRENGPNEDSSSDRGRLVQGLSVIYRVSTTRPDHLLCQGVSYDD